MTNEPVKLPKPFRKVYERPDGVQELVYYTTDQLLETIEAVRKEEREALPLGFLADVMTAAGLVRHGKQCKALAERLSEGVGAILARSKV